MLPFNLQTYSEMLNKGLASGYRFIGFDSLLNDRTSKQKKTLKTKELTQQSILLRHDIDGDLSAAIAMARQEAELGITSTYFLMWRSPCYNLMSRSSQNFAESIIQCGHQIGLHYDQGYDDDRDIPRQVSEVTIQREANWLEELLNTKIHAVSFHQPSLALLEEGINCGERINTYDKNLLSNFKYVSDSNREFSLWLNDNRSSLDYSDALANSWPQAMQILVHPMWWVYEESETNSVWDSVLRSNLLQTEKQLIATERAYGRKREFVIKSDNNNV